MKIVWKRDEPLTFKASCLRMC